MLNAGLLKSKQSLTYAELQNSIAKTLSTQMSEAEANAKSAEIITSMGLNTSMTSEGVQTVKLTSHKLKQAVVSGKLSKELATEIAMHNGVSLSMGKQTASAMPNWIASLKTSTLAIKEQTIQTVKWLATNPVAWCVAAAGAILLINNSIQKNLKSLKQQKELLEDTKNNISNYDSESSGIKGQISSNKEKINELKNSDNPVDKNTVSSLEEENAALTEQLQLLESLKEKEQEIAENAAMSILNNTAEITKLNKVFNDIKNFNFIDALKDSNMSVGAVSNSAEMWREGDIWGGIKNLGKGAVNTFNPLFGLVDWLTPQKENDKSIIEETDDQIAKVSELREKLAELESKRDSMSKNQYDKKHQKLTDNINEETGILTSDINELKTYQNTLDSTDPNQKAKIDEIQSVIDNYTKSMVKLEDYNSFEKIINSEIYGSSKNELIDLAVQGTLTEETLDKNFHNLYVLFDALGLKFDDITEKLKSMKGESIPEDAFIPSTICSAIDEIKEQLSSAFGALGSAYSEIFKTDSDTGSINFSLDNIDNNMLSNIKDSFSKLESFDTSNLEKFFSVLTNGASTSEQVQEAFDNLATSYLYSSTTLDNLNDSTVDAVAMQLEELGIVNARQVAYDTLNAKKDALNIMTKNGTQSQNDFFAMSYEAQAQLLNEANASEICRAHIARLQAQTINLNETRLSTADKIEKLKNLAKAYGLAGTAAQKMLDEAHWASIEEQEKKGAVTGQHKDGPMGYTEYDYQKAYEDFLKQTDEQFNTIKFNTGPDNNPNDTQKNTAKETEKSKEIFDWIETKINRLKTIISELGETASNTFKSLAERASAYGNEISKITEEIQLQKDAYSKYMEKANSVGLSEEWASKIRDGSLDISEITDDTLKTQIKDYQSWYDKAQDCLNTVNDLEQELAQLNMDRLQLSIDKASKNLDKFKSSSDRIQDKIDNDSRRTKVSDYNSLNKSYRNQIASYEEQNKLLCEQQQYVDKDSEKWAELETEIRNNNDAINDLKQNIKDNQNLKIQIRIDVKADELDNLEKYGSKISDKISLRETSGQTAKASDYSRLNANAGKQIQNLQAQNRLIRQQQKNVEKGSEAWNNYQDTIDSNNSSIRNLTKEMVENAKAMAALNNEAANKKIENINSSDELLDAKSAGTSSYKTKNSYINNKSANIDKRQKAYDGAVSSNKTKLNSAKKAINTIKSNSKNKGILKKIKSYVKSGKEIPVELIQSANSIDTNLAQKCAEYNAYLMELETSKTNAELYKYTSKQEKTELAKEKQSNIESYYSDRQSVYSQRATQLNSRIDLSQSKGYQISTKYYDKLIKNEEKNNASLTEEREKLVKTLDNSVKNGSIKKYSPEWYELCEQIDEVTNAIDDSTKSLVEYKNQLRQVKWDNFDYLEERISSIISESDFMINQLSRKDLTSNDTGGLTDEGKAVASLRLANYTAYKQQSYDYKREIDKIDKDLAKDPYNKELINRKEELIKLYQESINAANDEKDSVIDLYTQGYDALKNKIGEVISEYEELLDKEKNAYDYQNTIAYKTKQIASIRKQLAAYSKDTSEETKAKIQKLTVSLEEAEKDLKDTQYDRFISDTKDILGDLQDTLSDEIDNIIKNMRNNFDSLSNDIEGYSDNASKTITDEMKGIGYTPAEEFTTILNSSDFSTGMKETIRDIKDFCKEMGAFANEQIRKEDLAKALEDTSQKEKDKDAAKTELDKAKEKKDKAELEKNAKYYRYKNAQIKYGDNSTYANMAKAEYDASNLKYEESNSEYKKLKQKYSKANAEYKSAKAYSDVMNYLDKHLGSTKTSKEKLSDLNKVFYDRYDGKVLSKKEIEQLAGILNVKASSDKNGSLYKTLKNMGIPGFKNGSYNISGDHLALVAEEGQEIQFDKSQGALRTVGQGDMIFTNEMAENLWKLAQNTPIPFNTNAFNTAPLPEFNSNFNGGDVNINMGGIVMNGVNDPEEFSKELNRHLATNPKTIKILQNQSVGSLSRNYNSLGSRKYL